VKRSYYRGRDFRRAVSIDELRSLAERRLPRMAFEYLDGGAEDESTLRRNREVFERIAFLPRTLVNTSDRTQSIDLFGQPSQLPLVIAPTGFNGMLRRDADLALAASAKKAAIPFSLSTVSTSSIESVAERVGGRLWFQLYAMQDRTAVKRLVDRAAAANYEALVVTTDVPVYGNREWDQRNYRALAVPSPRTKLDVLAHPRWLFDVMIPHGAPALANLAEFLPPGKHSAFDGARYMSTQLNALLDWDAIRWMREIWPRRFIVKGLLAPRDAQLAAEHGVDGIVLSNHGGRQLDGAISPLEILPIVCREVGSRVTVMIDSGFRRGSDVVKALALGAKAVLIGRAVLYGLAAGGQPGAEHALGILRTEIDRVLALLGCRSCAELSPDYLFEARIIQ
jgi:(S)-mandelate dehydrogenase